MKKPVIQVVAAVIRDEDGKFLLTSRPEGKHMAGWWEMPGGKVGPGESHKKAIAREILEELGLAVAVGELLHIQRVVYPESVAKVWFYACVINKDAEILPQEGQEWGFYTLEDSLREQLALLPGGLAAMLAVI